MRVTYTLLVVCVSQSRCPIQSDTTAVWYGTTGSGGVGSLSEQWTQRFFDWWTTYDRNLKVQKLTARQVSHDCELTRFTNLKLYMQPGGDAYQQQLTLGSRGKNNINKYLDQGGSYFGVCAGGYYASSDYYWQSTYYAWPNLLGRAPTAEGSIIDLADYEGLDPFAITRSSNLDKSYLENVVYYGGPTRGWKDTPDNVPGETLLFFDEAFAKDGKPLIGAWKTRNGRMLFTSAHLEAYEGVGIQGYMSQDRQANYIWLSTHLNGVMGTNFHVPSRSDPILHLNQSLFPDANRTKV